MLKIVHGEEKHWQKIEKVLARVWGEDDYVAHSWLHNLQNPEAMLTIVALWDDTPVGTCNIALREDASAWFHAMRIDPDYQGRGISGEMTRFALDEVAKRGIKRCLAAIDGDNIASQKSAARAGFERVYVYEALVPSSRSEIDIDDAASDAALWCEVSLCEAGEYLEMALPYLNYPRDNMMIGWELISPKLEVLVDSLCWESWHDDSEQAGDSIAEGASSECSDEEEGKRCFFQGWKKDAARAYAAIYAFDEEAVVMSPVCSDIIAWHEALNALERVMQKENKLFCIWLTPDDPLYEATLQVGYSLKEENSYQIWQLLI